MTFLGNFAVRTGLAIGACATSLFAAQASTRDCDRYVLFDTAFTRLPEGVVAMRLLLSSATDGEAVLLSPVAGIEPGAKVHLDVIDWEGCFELGVVGRPAWAVGVVRRQADGNAVLHAMPLRAKRRRPERWEKAQSYIVDPEWLRDWSKSP